MAKDNVSICGIIIEHGHDDYGIWEGFCLSKEDEKTIWNILEKYNAQGCSVRGTRNEVLEDCKF